MKRAQLYLVIAALFATMSSVMASAAEDASDGTDTAAPLPSSPLPGFGYGPGSFSYDTAGIPSATGKTRHPLRVADGVNVYADATGGFGYDTNVNQGVKGSETPSMVYRLQPTVMAEALYRANTYRLAYSGDYSQYPDYNADSVNNHEFLFSARNIFDARTALSWGASYQDVFDPIGSTDRSVGVSDPDHHHDWMVNATGRYGADDAKGRVELDGGVGGSRFLNNRSTTTAADVDNTNVAARFFYRAAPKTRLLTELRRTTYDYIHDVNTLSNADWRLQVGATWDTTATITGAVKVGEQFKDYTNASRHDYTGSTWETSVRWKPLTYSSFDLVTGRAAVDPTGGTTAVPVTTNLSLGWNHDWTSYVHSNVSAGRERSRFEGSDRKDNETKYSTSLMYDWRQWLGVGLEFAYSHRESTQEQYNFSRLVSMVKLAASF